MSDKKEKSLDVVNVADAKKKVGDLVVIGDGDAWRLLGKASSAEQGWIESSKALPIEGVGAVVQVTTQQTNPDGSYAVAEAMCFVPGVKFAANERGGGGSLARDDSGDPQQDSPVKSQHPTPAEGTGEQQGKYALPTQDNGMPNPGDAARTVREIELEHMRKHNLPNSPGDRSGLSPEHGRQRAIDEQNLSKSSQPKATPSASSEK